MKARLEDVPLEVFFVMKLLFYFYCFSLFMWLVVGPTADPETTWMPW